MFFVPIAAVVFSLRASFIQSFVGFFFVGAGLVGIGFFEFFFFNYMRDAFEFLGSSVLLHFCQVSSISITGLFCPGGQTCDRTGTES